MNKVVLIGSVLFLLFLACARSENVERKTSVFQEEEKKGEKALEEDRYDILKEKSKEAYEFCTKNKYNTDFCILVDMKIPDGKNRLFVWNFKKDTVDRRALCAHGMGRGSTQDVPVFSNENGSYCTSLGKYKLGERAYSQYGINIHYKMHGLEKTNSNAYKRIVVLHSFDPVPEEEIYPNHLPLGWSLGCPVTNNGMMTYLDDLLKKQKKPTLLWIYY